MDGNSSLYNSSENALSENATGEDIAMNDTQNGFSYHNVYSNYVYESFLFEAFDFERPIYLFIWEILVIFTTLFNVLVILVLLGKKMRNVSNTVLVAIAVTDSMTGLVTLPTYIYTYSSYPEKGAGVMVSSYPQYDEGKMISNYSQYEEETTSLDFLTLDKHWCNAFMVSKYFLSRCFHNVSIWLTVFLGVHRFASVRFPFRSQTLFTIKNLIPCISLVVLTSLMICNLCSSTSQVMREGSSRSMIERRRARDKRMSIIVSTIAIVLLIPEIPYGVFLLFTVIQEHSKNKMMPLYVNRAFHAGYEILLVLSFHANFWIYTVLNKRFRSELKKTFKEVFSFVCRFWKTSRKNSITSTSSSSGRTADSLVTGKSVKKLKTFGGSSTSDSKSERGPLNDPSSEIEEKEERM